MATTHRGAGAAAIVLLIGAAAGAGGFTWVASLAAHVEYHDDEDLFGGSYAPFQPSLEVAAAWKKSLRFHGEVFTYRDLAAGDGFRGDYRSAYVEVHDWRAIRSARFGRFPLTTGIGFTAIDGGDVVVRPRPELELEAFAGRNKVIYDTRFGRSVLQRAPYTDTGTVAGGNLVYSGKQSGEIRIGLNRFDAGPDHDAEWSLLYGYSRRFAQLRFDLRGNQELSEGAGSEAFGRLAYQRDGGGEAGASYQRLRPDRRNPELVTSVFVADRVDVAGAFAAWPLSERVTLSGAYERYAFATPGGLDPSATSHALRAGLGLNHWTSHGLLADVAFRHLTGEMGELDEILASAEKRLTAWAALGLRLDWARFRREADPRETAYSIAATARVALARDLWLAAELEDYANLDFDYNFRARLTLEWTLSHARSE